MSRFQLIKAWRNDRHRFYTDAETGRIALADQSVFDNPANRDQLGPEGSNDGIIYVDFSRKARRRFVVDGERFSVPVVFPDGRQSWTIADSVEMHYLIETFRMEYQPATCDHSQYKSRSHPDGGHAPWCPTCDEFIQL